MFIGDLGEVKNIVEYMFWDSNVDWIIYRSDDGSTWTLHTFRSAGTGCTDGGDQHAGSFSARYIKVIRGTSAWCGDGNVIRMKISGNSATHTTAPTQIDGGANFWQWESFTDSKTTPANTSVSYRYRTSANGTDWTSWVGSIGSVTSRTGDDSNNPTKYRYLQIEATLSNTDGASTPTIDSYTIGYHTNQKPNAPTAMTAVVN
ncbi:MAG: hypothetical protein BWY29_01019 [Microgenomates group bacterium ADurb.Bin238]|nr:MAG: hypothetical protein BWY29_01019 [Microgenomates group bacterium ADurb.Bin238]